MVNGNGGGNGGGGGGGDALVNANTVWAGTLKDIR